MHLYINFTDKDKILYNAEKSDWLIIVFYSQKFVYNGLLNCYINV